MVDVPSLVEQVLREVFGSEPARASMSFVGVEPIEVLRFDLAGVRSYVTLGMSRYPMTAGDSYRRDGDGPRAELLVQVRGDHADLWRQLAVLAAAPVVEGVVYSEGMTVDLGQPISEATRCVGGVIVASPLSAVATPTGEVTILRLVPATRTELAYCRIHGSPALRTRWEETGTDLLDLSRAAVSLD